MIQIDLGVTPYHHQQLLSNSMSYFFFSKSKYTNDTSWEAGPWRINDDTYLEEKENKWGDKKKG